MNIRPFHLAIQVRDIDEAKAFYGDKLGFEEGRSSSTWVDYNMFGHQMVVHVNASLGKEGKIDNICNGVDGKSVPVPHFGVVLSMEEWKIFSTKMKSKIDNFIIEPYIRFEGEIGEQGTMFFSDPSGNALEFKGFKDIKKELFAT